MNGMPDIQTTTNMTHDSNVSNGSQWIENLSSIRLLGEILVADNKINRQQLQEALAISKKRKIRLGEVLQELGYVSETDILSVFGKNLKLKVIPSLDVKYLQRESFDSVFFSKFPMETIDKLCVLPLKLDVQQIPGKSSMVWFFHFIVSDPWQYSDVRRLAEDYVRREQANHAENKRLPGAEQTLFFEETDIRIDIVGALATAEDIKNVLGELEGRAESVVRIAGNVVEEGEELITRQIRDILSGAIARQATDIHITPLHRNGGLWVRYRIDGELHDIIRNGRYEAGEYNILLNKSLIMAHMDQTEKRRPQSGSMQFSYSGNIYDIRVETIPTSLSSVDNGGGRGLDGSKLLFRILYKETGLSIHDLGFSKKDKAVLTKIYTKPSGVMLVTGPTSSGKTTTIYSLLKSLDSSRQSIYTVEDPVEYYLDGATQISVNDKEGRGFREVLKSLMRLDPNIVFVGEMRDPESARAAMQIANTGHSVFSTLHTNSAYTAPQRLASIGVEPYLIIGNLNGIVAQRLVRMNCPKCLAPYTPSARTLNMLGLNKDETYWHGTGEINGQTCPYCGGLGTKGRVGIFEIVPLCEYEGWEKYIDQPSKLRFFFKERGYGDIMDDALDKMRARLISPDSLFGVLARIEVMIEHDKRTSM
jgi:type II secretory ATPase GspE/PulE/Tfp pilus assembly ATPase PilB-like protein